MKTMGLEFEITAMKVKRAYRGRWIAGVMLALVWIASGVDLLGAEAFRWEPVSTNSLGLWEGRRPVLVYNHGIIARAGIAADRARSSYIHPLYGLDGEVLTDDFPEDHLHHRGVFWAWPHVKVEGREVDLWMLRGVRHQFEQWLVREQSDEQALLGVRNGWFAGDKRIMEETMLMRVIRADAQGQMIDLDFTWTPTSHPVTLAGAEGKSYGGITIRYAPRTKTVITTPLGDKAEDLAMTRLPWADFSGQWLGRDVPSGAALFVHPSHPDHPPMWLTRHYGALCLGWPGIEPRTLAAGESARCRYRIWVHRQVPKVEDLKSAYAAYVDAPVNTDARLQQTGGVVPVEAKVLPDRVRVDVGGKLFTEYLLSEDLKYPYFYPIVGPKSGQSVTAHKTEPYPHHSSLFFGCDRVNGGNYWQEGLERGRIKSQRVEARQGGDGSVELRQWCSWERPGAPSPFEDVRRIRIGAPSADRRVMDFEVELKALVDVTIEKSNHSLFAARMAPDLAVGKGGRLHNAEGELTEKGTFGKRSTWVDFRGTRGGVVEGLAILPHPQNEGYPPLWFTRDYGFFSPTPMNWLERGKLEIPRGASMKLRYRVVIHADDPSPESLEAMVGDWRSAPSMER